MLITINITYTVKLEVILRTTNQWRAYTIFRHWALFRIYEQIKRYIKCC